MENEQEWRRLRLSGLVNREFCEDNDWVASAIHQRTGETVSVRTIQAWLIAPNRKSSRNCPEWALKALEEYIQDPSNEETIRYRKERYNASFSKMTTPLEWSNKVRSNLAVDFATNQLEHDARKLKKWQQEFGERQGVLIFELQKELQRSVTYHMKAISAIHKALDSSENFEEFRKKLKEQDRADSLVEYFVREAKEAIENNAEEFTDKSSETQ